MKTENRNQKSGVRRQKAEVRKFQASGFRLKACCLWLVVCSLLLAAWGASPAFAGDINPSAGPTDDSTRMFTLEQIYQKVLNGTDPTKHSGFEEPGAGPAPTMHTLDDIEGLIVSGTTDTTAGDVLDGKYFITRTAGSGESRVEGSMATQTLSDLNDTVAAGYYAATTLHAVDADLATANIKSGTTIFGIAGAPNVVDTTSGDAVAGEILSGKKAWVDGAEVTGDITTQTLSPLNDTVNAGYYTATTLHAVDADLATANIKSGTTIFGIAGAPNVVDTTSGDAVAGEILSGKKAWVDGAEVTGDITTQTLSDLNDTVAAGYYAATTLSTVDTDLAVGNIKEGVVIFGKTGTFPNDGTALAGEVKTGQTFYTNSSTKITGSGTQTLSPLSETVAAGYYTATTLSTVDNDLATANIKSGITIFGKAGDSNVVDTSLGTAAAGDILTGKIAYAAGSEVTGNVAAGSNVSGGNGDKTFTIPDGLYSGSKTATANDTDLAAGNIKDTVVIFGVTGTYTGGAGGGVPPTGQYTDHPTGAPFRTGDDAYYAGANPTLSYTESEPVVGERIITDNNTGLIWVKDPATDIGAPFDVAMSWNDAIDNCENLTFAGETDWRLPNVKELMSIVDYSRYNPSIDPLFTNTQASRYWSSTTYAGGADFAWGVYFSNGYVASANKVFGSGYVRPVRGGQ